jgi:hypothetical protein
MFTIHIPDSHESLVAEVTFGPDKEQKRLTLYLTRHMTYTNAIAILASDRTNGLKTHREMSVSKILRYMYTTWNVPLLVVDRLRYVLRSHVLNIKYT